MLLRPDWMRRAARIAELRKERVTVTIYKSLRQRQKELGLVTTTEEEAIKSTEDPTSSNNRKKKNKTTRKKKAMPQRYRVVSSAMINNRNQNNNNNNNNTSSNAYEDATSGRYDALNVYLFLPENNLDLNDKSNIIYRLDHGEIITSTTKKTVLVAAEDDKQQAQQQQQKQQQQQQQQQSTAVLWIEHDRGGWSPSIVNGVTRLVPIEYEP